MSDGCRIELREYSERSKWLDGRRFASAALALFLLNLAIRWPGTLTPDSISQLAEAKGGQFSDWHPPIMALLWRLMLPFDQGMFVLQVVLHWIGFALLAERLRRYDLHKWAYIMLASGLTPIAIKYTGVVQKDSLLASCMIAAAGLLSFRLRGSAIVLAVVATLSRMNGVFASPALFVRGRFAIPLSIAIAVALIPVSITLNRLVAAPSGVDRSLPLYDLAGIAYFSGDKSVLPVRIANLDQCYTPLFWDTLASARCDNAFQRLDRGIAADWASGVLHHPLAYARHRLSQFNRATFFLVPARQQCVDAPEFHDCTKGLLSELVEKNALLWPATWLVLGLALVTLRPSILPCALALSGLMYGFAYLVVGVAADFRYFYWTEIAIQSAVILHLASGGPWRRLVPPVVAVIILGYAARIIL